MPAVLVHGVPEIAIIWDPLRSHLDRTDVIALQLPGFGCPKPEGFGATKEEYVAWLVDQLELVKAEGPIDLVGHDWGGGFALRVASTRPELLRSWATDAASLGDEGFEWHQFAKIWQTPGDGEKYWEVELARPVEERAGLYERIGIPRERGVAMTAADETMVECILALYRSAVDVGREWAAEFRDIPAAGLVVVPSDDPFLSAEGARSAAKQAGGRVVELDGLGHWWMLQDPVRGAAMLEEFWSSVS